MQTTNISIPSLCNDKWELRYYNDKNSVCKIEDDKNSPLTLLFESTFFVSTILYLVQTRNMSILSLCNDKSKLGYYKNSKYLQNRRWQKQYILLLLLTFCRESLKGHLLFPISLSFKLTRSTYGSVMLTLVWPPSFRRPFKMPYFFHFYRTFLIS